MEKKVIFDKTLFLHKRIAKKFDYEITVHSKYRMIFDKYSNIIIPVKKDYVRLRTLELVAEEIKKNGISGDCAEAGVYRGDFSSAINQVFPDKKLFLYDTFEGFEKDDIEEQNKMYSLNNELYDLSEAVMDNAKMYSASQQIDIVKGKMKYPENVIIRKGYFPDTAIEECGNTFSFVSLDMDFYKPLYEGLIFFWPRMSVGGYIFMHDYNCYPELTEGAHQAIIDAQDKLGANFKIVPIPDEAGTVVIVK